MVESMKQNLKSLLRWTCLPQLTAIGCTMARLLKQWQTLDILWVILFVKLITKIRRTRKKAISDIIELNYSDTAAVENFLAKSKYYTEPINKQELIQRFKAKQPYVLNLEPFANGDTLIDASIKEIKIIFSAPMSKKGYSIDLGERGKDFFPIVGALGFSDDGISFTIKVDMKPNYEYEFVITDRSFKSIDGYPLKPYEVKFKTR